ncbi:proline--tRNA ligase [Marivibrio halodurans]|uniref:Proline--tRNA ligase n=1 Tax=Marivibrio halodurans TaxID=2039722 RepID=A0A8J7RXK3_9PROT|nr:proline--tRNA ligase [Marivibrio halodurans]MBP5856607.1 proline--tRNA ligase [Marivibrio halodurans]
MAKNALPVTRAENFANWYQEVIKAADMAEHSGVRGCMVIKPWGYKIWERIQRLLDNRIQETGHDNCYFPLFIPLSLIQKEASHVEGFAKEMAVVTHHRLVMEEGQLKPAAPLEEPLVVRPTSETMIGEAFARWIESYRDLPLKLNQWANVVRWEMRPRLFLRTSEFLWQEGHTAHATAEDAMDETKTMLEVYRQVVEDMMRIPLIPGEKSPGERFPGAVETHTIEAMMQDGRALQAGTSHYLGQNFAKAANIAFQDETGQQKLVHTTSWGASTRLVGGLIMTHSDDDGLRLPPIIAPHQIVILPIIRDESARGPVMEACQKLAGQLGQQRFAGEPVRAFVDTREDSAANKRWAWIKKGVPIICEIGPRDLENGTLALFRRDLAPNEKSFPKQEDLVAQAAAYLGEIDQALFDQANAFRKAQSRDDITDFADLKAHFAGENKTGFVRAKWCGDPGSEGGLDEFGVTIRCIPHEQSGTAGKCVLTGKDATTDVILAKAY